MNGARTTGGPSLIPGASFNFGEDGACAGTAEQQLSPWEVHPQYI